jgi:hypothetical protein
MTGFVHAKSPAKIVRDCEPKNSDGGAGTSCSGMVFRHVQSVQPFWRLQGKSRAPQTQFGENSLY